MRFATFVCGAVVAGLFAGAANAAIVLNEPFTYSNGELGAASGGAWALHSGTGGQTIASNQLAIDDNGTGDYNRAFTSPVSSGTVYAAFDLTVLSSDQPSSTATGGYFAHFGRYSTGTTVDTGAFISRLTAYRPSGSTAGKYTLAIGAAANPTVNWGTELDQDTTYQVVIAYNLGTNVASLWVNPSSEASTSVTNTGGSPANLAAFMFRISGTSDGDKTIDNLRVATTFNEATGIPEPGTLALAGLGLLAMATRRRGRAGV